MPFPTRKHTPSLPAGRTSTGMTVHKPGSSSPSRFREATRAVFGGIRNRGAAVKSNVRTGLAESGSRTDTLGGIFARNAAPMTAAGVAGAIDGSPVGVKVRELTGDMVEASTLLAGAGMVARGFGVDQRFLGRHVKRANVALIDAKLPILAYNIGRRGAESVTRRLSATAPVKTSGVGGEKAEIEAIPGEATAS